MRELTPLQSLNFFEQNLPEFLSTDIKTQIADLRRALQDEGSKNFHADLLKSGKNFIKHIISKSIECLSEENNSPKNRSIKVIEKYIEAFTTFEDMLFGLNPNYRDHTLHSLWIYLFGHEFIISIGGYETIKIASQHNITYFIENETKLVLWTDEQKGKPKHMEAMWGMISILHDLGYPIEGILKTPHEGFREIFDPFGIDFNSIFQIDLGSPITLLNQSICDLLSTMYRPERITPEEERKYLATAQEQGLIHHEYRPPTRDRDEGIEMEFRIASMDKTHSAWSSILAFKNIVYLHEGTYHGSGRRDYLKLLTQRDILYSILHHTSEEPNDVAVNRFQFVLLLIDDIEETARYSRGGKLRGLKSEHCEVKWKIDKDKTTVKLDYTNYEADTAQSKYEEMKNKYKVQRSRIINDLKYRYMIEIRFDGKNDFHQELKLLLSKDKEGMEAIPSPGAPETDA